MAVIQTNLSKMTLCACLRSNCEDFVETVFNSLCESIDLTRMISFQVHNV